jgi:hypothetical protein
MWLPLSGTQNNSGQQVFDCVPANGIIPKGGVVEVTMTFAPDHASDHFSDGVRIDLFGQEEQHVFQVKYKAKNISVNNRCHFIGSDSYMYNLL